MTEQPPPYTLDSLAGQPPARRRPRWPWIAAGAAVVLALVAGLTVWLAMPSLEDKAIEKCQTEIDAKLKAPATAEYTVTAIEVRGDTGHVFIDGTVDAENGFGAKVRNTWRCEIYTENDGDTWAVNALRLT